MENILFEHKEITLVNEWHFVENKEIMHRVLEIQYISLLPEYIKYTSQERFPHTRSLLAK
jgi:hypothetical protein